MRGKFHHGYELVNLTSHEVIIERDDFRLVLPPDGRVARIIYNQHTVHTVGDIPVVCNDEGVMKWLLPPRENTYYVTSSLVAMNTERPDVLCPNMDPNAVIRDVFGNVKGTTSLLSFNLGQSFETLHPE